MSLSGCLGVYQACGLDCYLETGSSLLWLGQQFIAVSRPVIPNGGSSNIVGSSCSPAVSAPGPCRQLLITIQAATHYHTGSYSLPYRQLLITIQAATHYHTRHANQHTRHSSSAHSSPHMSTSIATHHCCHLTHHHTHQHTVQSTTLISTLITVQSTTITSTLISTVGTTHHHIHCHTSLRSSHSSAHCPINHNHQHAHQHTVQSSYPYARVRRCEGRASRRATADETHTPELPGHILCGVCITFYVFAHSRAGLL